MEKSNKLNAKDLINVGIYTAIYLVVFFSIGMLNMFPVMYPALYLIWPVVTGIPFMLFLTKVNKFGMVSIMSTILGVAWFLMGYTWIAIPGYVITGLLADFIFKSGNYKSFTISIFGYWMFSLGIIGLQIPIWVMADAYIGGIRESMGDQYADQLVNYMPWWMGIAAIVIIFIGALAGAFLGKKMLKKHFERAGIA